jgi:hypothetical protein
MRKENGYISFKGFSAAPSVASSMKDSFETCYAEIAMSVALFIASEKACELETAETAVCMFPGSSL